MANVVLAPDGATQQQARPETIDATDLSDDVDAGTGWTDGGFDGSGNHIFTQAVGGNTATLLIDPDITINPDIV